LFSLSSSHYKDFADLVGTDVLVVAQLRWGLLKMTVDVEGMLAITLSPSSLKR